MPRHRTRHHGNAQGQASARPAKPGVLLVGPCCNDRNAIAERLGQSDLSVRMEASTQGALASLEVHATDVVVIDDAVGAGCWELLSHLSRRNVGRVLIMRAPTANDAIRAARTRVREIVPCENGGPDATAVLRAVTLARASVIRARARRERREKLNNKIRALREAHTNLLSQVGTMCAGMGETCRGLSDQLQRVALGAEFNALIRQELELEGLLRTTLEYVLRRAGSTNAAIFLPSSSGDYSLGAYINFDLPKDSAESMLEQLAGSLAPACEQHRELTFAGSAAELGVPELNGDHWLSGSNLAVRACWSSQECIAVLAIFRDARNSFPTALHPELSIITDLFGAQLARVIKTHYRHKPKEEWGASDAAAA